MWLRRILHNDIAVPRTNFSFQFRMVKEPPVYAHALTRLSGLVLSGTIKLGKDLLESVQWLQWRKKVICIAKTSIKKGAKKISKLLSAGETASILHTPPS